MPCRSEARRLARSACRPSGVRVGVKVGEGGRVRTLDVVRARGRAREAGVAGARGAGSAGPRTHVAVVQRLLERRGQPGVDPRANAPLHVRNLRSLRPPRGPHRLAQLGAALLLRRLPHLPRRVANHGRARGGRGGRGARLRRIGEGRRRGRRRAAVGGGDGGGGGARRPLLARRRRAGRALEPGVPRVRAREGEQLVAPLPLQQRHLAPQQPEPVDVVGVGRERGVVAPILPRLDAQAQRAERTLRVGGRDGGVWQKRLRARRGQIGTSFRRSVPSIAANLRAGYLACVEGRGTPLHRPVREARLMRRAFGCIIGGAPGASITCAFERRIVRQPKAAWQSGRRARHCAALGWKLVEEARMASTRNYAREPRGRLKN